MQGAGLSTSLMIMDDCIHSWNLSERHLNTTPILQMRKLILREAKELWVSKGGPDLILADTSPCADLLARCPWVGRTADTSDSHRVLVTNADPGPTQPHGRDAVGDSGGTCSD